MFGNKKYQNIETRYCTKAIKIISLLKKIT